MPSNHSTKYYKFFGETKKINIYTLTYPLSKYSLSLKCELNTYSHPFISYSNLIIIIKNSGFELLIF